MTQDQFLKGNAAGLNSELSFSKTGCQTKATEHSLPYYVHITGGRRDGFMPFPKTLALRET